MKRVLFCLVFSFVFHHSAYSAPKKSKCKRAASGLSSHSSKTLSPERIEDLPLEEFIALIPELTFRQISALPSKPFAALTLDHIAALVPKLTPAQLWAVFHFLSSRQAGALNFGDGLSSKQVDFLINKLIAFARTWFFEPGSLKVEQIKLIDKTISVIRKSLFKKRRTLTTQQAQSLPPDFIEAFRSDLYGMIP